MTQQKFTDEEQHEKVECYPTKPKESAEYLDCPKCGERGTQYLRYEKNGSVILNFIHNIYSVRYTDVKTGKLSRRGIQKRRSCLIGKIVAIDDLMKKEPRRPPVYVVCPVCNQKGRAAKLHRPSRKTRVEYYVDHRVNRKGTRHYMNTLEEMQIIKDALKE